MNRCPKCGIEAEGIFCPECGQRIDKIKQRSKQGNVDKNIIAGNKKKNGIDYVDLFFNLRWWGATVSGIVIALWVTLAKNNLIAGMLILIAGGLFCPVVQKKFTYGKQILIRLSAILLVAIAAVLLTEGGENLDETAYNTEYSNYQNDHDKNDGGNDLDRALPQSYVDEKSDTDSYKNNENDASNEMDYNDVLTERCVRESLEVDDDAKIIVEYGKPYFDEGSGSYLVAVAVLGTGKYYDYEAAGSFSTETGEIHSVLIWHQKVESSARDNSSEHTAGMLERNDIDYNELKEKIMVYYALLYSTNNVAAEVDHEDDDTVTIRLYDPYSTTTSSTLGFYEYNKITVDWVDKATGKTIDFDAAYEAHNERLEVHNSSSEETTIGEYYVYVNAPDGYVNLRTGPGTEYDIICPIPNGEALELYTKDATAKNGKKWAKVAYWYDGEWYTGYVIASQIEY